MRVNALDHVNIRTRDLAASARFYADLLDLEPRDPTTVYPGEKAKWMYDQGGRAIIHLRTFDCEPGSTGVIDHVALDCSGKADVLERVKALGMEFAKRQGEGWSVIYTRDPHGLMLELYFAE